MKTYWTYSVEVANGGCISCSSGETIEIALQRAIKDLIYYQAVHPGERITLCRFEEHCAACGNNGTLIRRKRVIRCTECRGKCPTTKIGPIDLRMPDPANRIRLMMDDPASELAESLAELSEWMRWHTGPSDGTHDMLCKAVNLLKRTECLVGVQ